MSCDHCWLAIQEDRAGRALIGALRQPTNPALGDRIRLAIAFALALAVLIRAGIHALANPLAYVLGGAAGGTLLYLIMMEGIAPSLNRTIVDFTPRTPFFLAHLALGATVAAWVYWRGAPSGVHPVVRADRHYPPA